MSERYTVNPQLERGRVLVEMTSAEAEDLLLHSGCPPTANNKFAPRLKCNISSTTTLRTAACALELWSLMEYMA